jgi:hypothetical protein
MIDHTDAIVKAAVACRKTLMALAALPGALPELKDQPRASLRERCQAVSRP